MWVNIEAITGSFSSNKHVVETGAQVISTIINNNFENPFSSIGARFNWLGTGTRSIFNASNAKFFSPNNTRMYYFTSRHSLSCFREVTSAAVSRCETSGQRISILSSIAGTSRRRARSLSSEQLMQIFRTGVRKWVALIWPVFSVRRFPSWQCLVLFISMMNVNTTDPKRRRNYDQDPSRWNPSLLTKEEKKREIILISATKANERS